MAFGLRLLIASQRRAATSAASTRLRGCRNRGSAASYPSSANVTPPDELRRALCCAIQATRPLAHSIVRSICLMRHGKTLAARLGRRPERRHRTGSPRRFFADAQDAMFPIAKAALSFGEIADYWSRYSRVPTVFVQRVAPLALLDCVFPVREAPDNPRSAHDFSAACVHAVRIAEAI